MMISISTLTSRIPGNVIINGNSETQVKTNTARVITVPTLDGGSVVVHSGSSVKDRPLKVAGTISKEQEEILWDFFNNETYVLFVIGNEIFKVAIANLKTDGGELDMKLIIYNKEN